MRFDDNFLLNQEQQQCLPQFESILDCHLTGHLPASFRLQSLIPPKHAWSVQNLIPISFLYQY
jgi:hypothetical protein